MLADGKKEYNANGNDKKVGVAILISDNIHFKAKSISKDKEEHNIRIKGSIQGENITLVNMYTPNTEHLNI